MKKMSMKQYEKSDMDKKADKKELAAVNAKRMKAGKDKPKKGAKKSGY